MSGGVRAAVALFVVGLLLIWLIRPIGNACGDLDKLPSGSTASSAPSFTPPITRTCTYTTPDGTRASKRYVPMLDVFALLLAAGVVGGAIGLAGAVRRERAPKLPRPAEPRQPERSAQPDQPLPAERPSEAEKQARGERDAAERERARQAREGRRRR